MSAPSPLRLLLVSQGQLGSVVFGHVTTASSLTSGLGALPDLTAELVTMPARRRWENVTSHPVPGLSRYDLDAADARWLAVEARRGREVIEEAVARLHPDVVHVNSHTAGIGARATMARLPVMLAVDVTVMDWRRMGIWRPMRPYSELVMRGALARERAGLRACAQVVTYSQWAADAVRRQCPDAAPTQVVHPGLDAEHFRPAAREPRERPRVLFVGGRFRAKGGYDLLEALGPDLGTLADLDVVTTEDVPPRPGLHVHRLSAGDTRLVELYQQADLFCLPSLGDAMPWSLLEALACGTPVLTSPVGANAEVCGDGPGTGALAPAGDVRALRESLLRLLADPARLAVMGRAGRALVEDRFDSRRQARVLAELAASLADRHRASRPRGGLQSA